MASTNATSGETSRPHPIDLGAAEPALRDGRGKVRVWNQDSPVMPNSIGVLT
ncbi:hypothetical protein [Nitrosomonas sp.]|uniref:hypothetical protein n=1 Tax=Nitrosomonas sp. TaxID=42353 RepID=UPI00271A3E23|nr:hypothetical protein [Nitrosomonas sp.]MDO8895913.1 hypothetical protein [Nitrosomonas sp.]